MTVVETPFYLRKTAGLLTEDERERLVEHLGSNPLAGDVIPETGGVRKIRWAISGRGKRVASGSSIMSAVNGLPLFLLTVYAKNQKANLTKAERNEMKTITSLLASGYSKSRTK